MAQYPDFGSFIRDPSGIFTSVALCPSRTFLEGLRCSVPASDPRDCSGCSRSENGLGILRVGYLRADAISKVETRRNHIATCYPTNINPYASHTRHWSYVNNSPCWMCPNFLLLEALSYWTPGLAELGSMRSSGLWSRLPNSPKLPRSTQVLKVSVIGL